MRLGDLLTDLGHPVAYYPALANVLGGVQATLLFCQLCYWLGKQRDPDGWIRKSSIELTTETGLSRKEQETARKNLRRLGIVETRRKGLPATTEFRIVVEALDALWAQRSGPTSPQLQDAPKGTTGCADRHIQSSACAQHLEETENTLETTADISSLSPTTKTRTAETIQSGSTRARARGTVTPIPVDLQLTPAMREAITQAGCHDPEAAFRQFVDKHTALQKPYFDWQGAVWRGWVSKHGQYACPCGATRKQAASRSSSRAFPRAKIRRAGAA
jgi:hypothetical protein